jgi:cytochrome c oxidase subunit 1
MAIINETLAVHARKKIFGYRAVAFSSLAIAGISFLVWGHHMFTSQGEVASVIFSALTFLVAIPTAVKVFNWTFTLYKGTISLTTPMLYTLTFLFTFTIGGLTGLPLATLVTDVHLTDSYFVVAHFHYVMMGGSVIAMLGGLHHWWPKFFGKMYNEFWARIGCILIFIGFNTTFFVQFILGTRGMPRRYASYVDSFQTCTSQHDRVADHLPGDADAPVRVHPLAGGGQEGPAQPVGRPVAGVGADSPPIEHNFHHEPVVKHGPYDYDDFVPPRCDPKDFPLPAGAPVH